MTSVYVTATLKEIMLATAGEPIYQQHAVHVSSKKLGESPPRRELQWCSPRTRFLWVCRDTLTDWSLHGSDRLPTWRNDAEYTHTTNGWVGAHTPKPLRGSRRPLMAPVHLWGGGAIVQSRATRIHRVVRLLGVWYQAGTVVWTDKCLRRGNDPSQTLTGKLIIIIRVKG